jgi:MoaA/NifB/PqqE/SkfB family radical SAM enzyme
MKKSEVLNAWASILAGQKPSLSIEITRECPLRCPGCYAYEPEHLGEGAVNLRQLADYRGDDLVRRLLAIVDQERPIHLSLVGGDPLVRYRELEVLLPQLERRGIHVQLVTSAFRPLPKAWTNLSRLSLVVSIDGLQPEHDERRKPATYERILNSIRDSLVTIHCTVTGQIAGRPGYLEEFLRLWSARPEVKRIWVSLFTPQQGAEGPELISPAMRRLVLDELERLFPLYPKFQMNQAVIEELRHPPQSPEECIFARTTLSLSADLQTRIGPCQFGGKPDCTQCGCIASMGLAAVGHHRVLPGLTAGDLMLASERVGEGIGSGRVPHVRPSVPGFPVTQHQTGPRVRLSLRKAAWSSTTPPTSTGNPGYVGRKRRAKPATAKQHPCRDPPHSPPRHLQTAQHSPEAG